jgi:hypothetical protein
MAEEQVATQGATDPLVERHAMRFRSMVLTMLDSQKTPVRRLKLLARLSRELDELAPDLERALRTD